MPRTLTEQEYNAVREQVMKSAPPNMDEATFTRWIGPQMQAAIVEAELKPPMQQDSAAWRFASNAASMLNPIAMVEGAWNALPIPQALGGSGIVQGPATAVANIGRDMADQGQQAIDAARQGHYSEAAGHGAAAMLPVIGPAAARIGEQAASGDVAGAAGAFTGMTAPIVAPAVVRGASRLAPASVRDAAATSLEHGAASRYTDVISPKVGANKTRFGGMAKDVAPDLAANPDMAAWSRSGLHANVQQAFEAAKSQLDAATDARNVGQAFDTKPILDALQQARRALVAEPVEASHVTPAKTNLLPNGQETNLTRNEAVPIGKAVEPKPNAPRIASIDAVISEVQQLGPIARYESLRRIRQAWDSVAKQVYAPSITQDFTKVKGEGLGAADATAALREQLAQMDPQTDVANQQYSLYKKANDVLDATAEVERTRPKVGRAIIARLTSTILGGEAAGAAGAAAGFVLGPTMESALSSGATTKLMTGQLMTKLAAAIRAGDTQAVTSIAARLKDAAAKWKGTAAKLAPSAAVRNSAMVPTAAGFPATIGAPSAQR